MNLQGAYLNTSVWPALSNQVRFGHAARVAVVDSFTKKDMDIDGDGISDLSHGELVERLVKAYHPETKVDRYELPEERSERNDKAVEHFFELALKAEQGERYDAVNVSMSGDMPYEALSFEVSDSTKQSSVEQARPDTLTKFRDAICQFIKGHSDKTLKQFSMIIEFLEDLAKGNVPVHIAAGNDGNQLFNIASLAKGVISVGALDSKGQKAAFTASHELVNRYEIGNFVVTKTSDGFDINGDAQTDVFDDEVSGGLPLYLQYHLKPKAEVCHTPEEIEKMIRTLASGQSVDMDVFYAKLFDVKELIAAYLKVLDENPQAAAVIEADSLVKIRQRGQVVKLDPENPVFFKLDEKNIVRFEPDGHYNSSLPVVSAFWGTSFAAPASIGKDLAKVCQNQADSN